MGRPLGNIGAVVANALEKVGYLEKIGGLHHAACILLQNLNQRCAHLRVVQIGCVIPLDKPKQKLHQSSAKELLYPASQYYEDERSHEWGIVAAWEPMHQANH